MVASFYIASIALGVMIGASVVGIINHRQDKKDREAERFRHETVCVMLSNMELTMLDMKCRYDEMFEKADVEITAFEKEFIRRSRVLYASIADDAKSNEIGD